MQSNWIYSNTCGGSGLWRDMGVGACERGKVRSWKVNRLLIVARAKICLEFTFAVIQYLYTYLILYRHLLVPDQKQSHGMVLSRLSDVLTY